MTHFSFLKGEGLKVILEGYPISLKLGAKGFSMV